MGDILRALGLGGHPPQAAVPNAPQGSPAPIDPLAPLPEQAKDIVITGDTFHPRKPSILAILGDAILAHGGYAPQFSQNRRNEDYRRAVQGFDEDPIRAIHRLSMLKGHEKDAQKLWDTYQDNNRLEEAQTRQNRVFDLKVEDYVRDRAAGAMGSVKPGDKDGYKRMRDRMLSYGSAKGVDLSADIPENGDSLDIDALRNGQIDPYKTERLHDFDTQEADRNARAATEEAGRNARAAMTEGGRDARFEKGQASTESRFTRAQQAVADRFRQTRPGAAAGLTTSRSTGRTPDAVLKKPKEGDTLFSADKSKVSQYKGGRWVHGQRGADGKFYPID